MKAKRFSNNEDFLKAWDQKYVKISKEMLQMWFNDWVLRMENHFTCDGYHFEKKNYFIKYCKTFLVPFI